MDAAPRAPAPKAVWCAFVCSACARTQARTVRAKALALYPTSGDSAARVVLCFLMRLSRPQVRQQSRDEAKGAAADSRVAAAAHASPASGLTADDGQPQPGSKATACEPELEAKAAPEPEPEVAKGQTGRLVKEKSGDGARFRI